MLHASLEPVLSETYGVIIYQEQVMRIAQVLSGYSLGEADILRRAMGKKNKEEMAGQRARFISGAVERGVVEETAGSIFDLVDKFAGYGFNKSHAAAYALIAYQTGWMKANTPVEFMAATMSLDLSNSDKLAQFYQDAKRFKIPVRAPDINRSGADFEVADGEVLYALGAVRNVGLAAMEHVVAVRTEGGPFRDLHDFLARIDARVVNKRSLENLARAGAFDSIHPNRAEIVEAAEALVAYAQDATAARISSQEDMFGGAAAAKPRVAKVEPWPLIRQLDEELAAVGFYLTGHPLEHMLEVLRRRRVLPYIEAVARAEAGDEAFRMAGVIRRRQERAGASGDKFAFVGMSDPTGEYEVMFQPEALRRCRDQLEPGQSVILRVRAKFRDGEVRFFGEDAEPLSRLVETSVSGVRLHLSQVGADLPALTKRLATGQSERGGEVILVAPLEGGREVEMRLPGRFMLDVAFRAALKTAPGVVMLEDV